MAAKKAPNWSNLSRSRGRRGNDRAINNIIAMDIHSDHAVSWIDSRRDTSDQAGLRYLENFQAPHLHWSRPQTSTFDEAHSQGIDFTRSLGNGTSKPR